MSTLSPHRITYWQIAWANIADRLGIEPDHEGADTLNWAHELRNMRLDRPAGRHATDTPTATIPAVRQPIAAIAAEPYQLVDDPIFGVLPIGPLEPAHIHDALKGAQR